MYEEAYGVACDPNGPIIVVGSIDEDNGKILVARYELDGTLTYQKTITNFDSDYSVNGVDVAIDSRGNAYISAGCEVADGGGSAALVIKLNNTGNVQWT